MLVFHHWLFPLPPFSRESSFSLREGELLAGPRGFIPFLSNAWGKLFGPLSWALALALSLVLRNLRASSEVKVMFELVPPRNFSQPGAPLAAMVAGEERLAVGGGRGLGLGASSSIRRAGGGGKGVSLLKTSPS